MCYNIPVIEALHSDPGSSALYIFPTKALAQDQLRATRELLLAAFGHEGPQIDVRIRPSSLATEVYDGDTPMDKRSE
eukprot:scaffold363637_cov19-Prasinocladus_malaysianus.AAC.1